MKNVLFIVEGNHDIAYLAKTLQWLGYSEIKKENQLNTIMQKLYPSKFPFIKDDLNLFNKIPIYFGNKDVQLALISANGERNLFTKIDDKFAALDKEDIRKIDKVLIFCDGDTKNKDEKLADILDNNYPSEKIEEFEETYLSNIPRKIKSDNFSIDLSIFVFPNNNDKGRLENVILECIDTTDTELLKQTNVFLSTIDDNYKVNWNDSNSKKEKTSIGIVGNIKNPGSSITVAIADAKMQTEWINDITCVKIEDIEILVDFLKYELDIN